MAKRLMLECITHFEFKLPLQIHAIWYTRTVCFYRNGKIFTQWINSAETFASWLFHKTDSLACFHSFSTRVKIIYCDCRAVIFFMLFRQNEILTFLLKHASTFLQQVIKLCWASCKNNLSAMNPLKLEECLLDSCCLLIYLLLWTMTKRWAITIKVILTVTDLV